MIQTNLIKWSIRRDQVNLLVYGPDQLYFKQKQKNITKFWPTGFFFNLRFSAFLTKKRKEKEK